MSNADSIQRLRGFRKVGCKNRERESVKKFGFYPQIICVRYQVIDSLKSELVGFRGGKLANGQLSMRRATDIACAFDSKREFLIGVNVDVCPGGTWSRWEIDSVEPRRSQVVEALFRRAGQSAPHLHNSRETAR